MERFLRQKLPNGDFVNVEPKHFIRIENERDLADFIIEPRDNCLVFQKYDGEQITIDEKDVDVFVTELYEYLGNCIRKQQLIEKLIFFENVR